MDEKKPDSQLTFTRTRGGNRRILAVTIGAVIVILVATVIVLAALLVRKVNDETWTADSGDKGGQGQPEKVVPLSIVSGGVVNNSIHISVSYRAPKQHTTAWFVRYQDKDTYMTAGTVKSRGNDDHSFITEIVLNDVVDVTFFYLKLQSTTEKVIIELGKKFPTEKGSVDIPAWRNEVHIEDNIVAPTDTNTNMTIDVSLTVDLNFLHMLNQSSESVTDLVNEKIDMLLAGINTTANPHKLYPVSGESFFINVKSIGETIINLSVYIPAEYVQYGCLFGLNVFENVSTNFISKLEHGMYIKVLSPVTNVVIPEGVIAMHPFPHETYIYTKRTTLTCFSMGNPHPEATLYKQGQGQEYISLKSKQEKLISSDVSLTVGYTVEANDTDNQGRYMCRARSGKVTKETTTEVIFVEQSVINIAETGVIENTTERTTIKCQASGKPRPTIELNLFEEDGPNLMQTGLYQIKHTSQGTDIATVTLTIAPPDYGIHTVYCVMSQSWARSGDPMKIEIFQSVEGNTKDWDLRKRMRDLINEHSAITPSN